GMLGMWQQSLADQDTMNLANRVLSLVLDKEARFVWGGRRNTEKLWITDGTPRAVPGLDSLSAGQSSLLSVFGTILRYGDHGPAPLKSEEITGICILDEVDAHMHVGLQYRALPDLIKLFPKVQFILSSHSPLFVLGMEKAFGDDGVLVVEMPSATPIGGEAYSEFDRIIE